MICCLKIIVNKCCGQLINPLVPSLDVGKCNKVEHKYIVYSYVELLMFLVPVI